MSEATITEQTGGVTFIQIWTVGSPDRQAGWLGVMRRNIGILTSQPGFVSISHHVSLDGARIAVYAQWESEDRASAAVRLPAGRLAHEEMTKWGTADGAFYRVDALFLPGEG